MLVVELQEWNSDQIFLCCSCIFDRLENVVNCTRNYASQLVVICYSLHCKGFSCSCLAIRKNSTVVAFQNTLNNGESCLLENRRLHAVRGKNGVIGEVSRGREVAFLRVGVFDSDPSDAFINMDNKFMSCLLFFFWGRSAPDNHFYSLSLRTHRFRWHKFKLYWYFR